MQPQMLETTTAATHDKPGVAVDRLAKPAASLTGDMVMRRSPTEAALALASAKPTAEPGSAEPGPAPVRPADATPADREERPAGPVRKTLADLRALGSRLVPQPAAAGGPRHGLGLPKWGTATAIFVFAYLSFVVAILAGLKLMPELLLPL